MKHDIMSPEQLAKSLAIPDLSDPANGIHAINLMFEKFRIYLDGKAGLNGWPALEVRRSNPITSIANNFDRLLFPENNAGRSSVYTRHVSEQSVLRTHTSCMIPDILEELPARGIEDYLVLCPGICYRRDVVDKIHCGEPHQLDIWRIHKGEPRLERKDLIKLIEAVIDCAIPGCKYRANEVIHPYTINGLEVEILVSGAWIELLECGEAHPQVLRNSGLNPEVYSGLALGMGLDRLVMIAKGIDDIRILRSQDPRIRKQMLDLAPFKPVSKYPPIRQDLSLSVATEKTEEDICEAVIGVMGDDAGILEEILIRSETPYEDLPPQAVERLGIKPGQKNVLMRVTLRSHDRSLLQEEANEIRNKIYLSINESATDGYLSMK